MPPSPTCSITAPAARTYWPGSRRRPWGCFRTEIAAQSGAGFDRRYIGSLAHLGQWREHEQKDRRSHPRPADEDAGSNAERRGYEGGKERAKRVRDAVREHLERG